MISLPSDFTAAPVHPSSGIAPKELIGNANFPQLLGGFQAGTANPQEVSAQAKTGLDASKGAGPALLVDGQPPAPPLSGNLLPRSGTALPLDQQLTLEGGEGSGIRPGEVLEASDQAQFDLSAPYAAPVETRAIEGNESDEASFAVQPVASPVAPAQIANKPMEHADRPSRAFLAAGQLLQSQALPSRSMVGNDVRAAAVTSGSRFALVPGELTQGSKGNPLPPAVLNMESEVDPDMPRVPLPAAAMGGGAAATTAQAALLGLGDTAAPQPPASQPPVLQPQAAAVPAAPQPNAPAPVTDTSAVVRATPQLESAIEQLAETRSAAQANKPELTVRHQEFGAITMRLETTAGDLRATLSARDPGFVPAIQAALAERSIAASSDASTNNSNKGGDQTGSGSDPRGNQQSGSFAGSHGQNHGQGWGFGAGYGSSTGSGQGTSQPYPGQTGDRDEESGSDLGNRGMGLGTGRGDGPEGEGEIFA